MKQARCPICHRPLRGATSASNPHFPFCSQRCKLVDLGRWLRGDYTIGEPDEQESEQDGRHEESLT